MYEEQEAFDRALVRGGTLNETKIRSPGSRDLADALDVTKTVASV